MTYRLLLVDDDKENLRDTKNWLESYGYEVVTAQTATEAIKKIKNAKMNFVIVLMDYRLPDMYGDKAIEEIKKIRPNQQIIGYSIDDRKEVMRENFKAGAVDFIDKNSDPDTFLLPVIQAHCAKYDKIYRSIEKPAFLDEKGTFIAEAEMVGRSNALYELCKEIRKVGPTMATTLVYGESGTGKELVAKALHKFSHRSRGPYVAFNIAAANANLLDSALFGHRKGAFTDAVADSPGQFKLADGGTIFLDEIGDLNLDLQVKLLRVLQEREINPVGASKPIPVDVRVVAATNKNLEKMVKEGAFREDLYYRINTVMLKTTPLRERPEDIELLVAQFTEEICEENHFHRQFHRSCIETFCKFGWPGNIRQLRSTVESHLVKSDVGMIYPDKLDAYLFSEYEAPVPKTMTEIDEHLEDIKKAIVLKVVEGAATKAEAARTLKISPIQLHYFLKKWGSEIKGRCTGRTG